MPDAHGSLSSGGLRLLRAAPGGSRLPKRARDQGAGGRGSPKPLISSAAEGLMAGGRFGRVGLRDRQHARSVEGSRSTAASRVRNHVRVLIRRTVLLGCVFGVVVGCTLASTAALGQPAPLRRVGGAGVTLALPHGWQAIHLMVPPPSMEVGDPVTRIVAASGPIRFGKGCNDVDYSFPSTAVALVVLEWVRLTPHLPARPQRFTQTSLPVRPAPTIECFNGPGGSVQFTDHGRRFDAFLLLGRRASPELANDARAALNTLRVTQQGGCTADATQALIRRFVQGYNTGQVAAIDRLFAPEPRFVWFSTVAPGARLGPRAHNRAILATYFRSRVRVHERIRLLELHAGYDPKRNLVNFGGKLVRTADDGRPMPPHDFKGAADCVSGHPSLIVWSM